MLPRLKILILMLVIALFALPSIPLAQENTKEKEKKAEEIEEIVVTATRREIPLKDAPANVTVIDRKTIENSPAKTIDDLLKTIVGIDTLESDRTEKTKRSVKLRGVPNQGKTLVLLDGMPLNWPIHGDVEWSAISIDSIDRIEIVRGPASSLYGSHAMGGVINIFTKAPKKKLETKVKQNFGTNNTASSTVNIGGRTTERFGYYLSARNSETNGYYSTPKPLPPFSTKNAREANNINGRLYWFLDDVSSLTLGLLRSSNDRNRGREFEKSDRQTMGSYFTYRRHAGTGPDWLSSIYWHTTDYHTEFDKRDTYDCVEHIENKYSTHWGGMVQVSWPVFDGNTFTAGLEYRHNEFDQDDGYLLKVRQAECQGKQKYRSVYIQDEMALLEDRFLVTVGVRGDWWKSHDGQCSDTDPSGPVAPYDDDYPSKKYNSFNPKLGLRYHLSDSTSLRSSVGKGFQAPNIFEMYRTFQRGKNLTLSNPELKSETLVSYEVGIDQFFTPKLLTKLTLYDSYGNDFIGNRYIEGNNWKTYQVDNFTEVRMRGIEAELKWRVTEQWSAFSNYTLGEATIEKNDPDPTLEGNYLENSPRKKSSLGVTYDNPHLLTVTALIWCNDKMYSDAENTEKLSDYTTLDIKCQREIGERVKISVNCENVFDKEYEIPDHSIQIAPGQFWTFSISSEF